MKTTQPFWRAGVIYHGTGSTAKLPVSRQASIKTCLTPHRAQHCSAKSQESTAEQKSGEEEKVSSKEECWAAWAGNLWNHGCCSSSSGSQVWEMTWVSSHTTEFFSFHICKVSFFFLLEHISHRCLIIFSSTIYHLSFFRMKRSQSTSGMFSPEQCRQAPSFVWYVISLCT